MSLNLIGQYKPNEILNLDTHSDSYVFSLNDKRPEIKAIILPESCISLENIEKEINMVFPNLEEVIWPKIENMNSGTFANCKHLKYFQTESCEMLPPSAFFNSGLTAITFPKDLKQLGTFCFQDCMNLSLVDMSKLDIRYIDIPEYCFMNCKELTKFNFSKCKYIHSYAFNNSGIKRAVFDFSDFTGYIGSFAFSYCGLEYLEIIGKVKLESECFNNNYKLKEVILNGNITCLPDNSFSDDVSLEKISGVENIIEVGCDCFSNCLLSTFDGFKNLEIIGDSAFFKNNFKEIKTNANIIGNNAFSFCLNLKSATFTSPNLKELKRDVFLKSNIESLNIEHTGITFIPSYMFKNSKLKSITLPMGLTTIGQQAFSGTELLQITIPDSVTMVDEKAFYKCKYLTEVIWSPNCKKINTSTFGFCKSLTSLIGSEYVELIEDFAFEEDSVNLNLPNLKEANFFAFLGEYTGIADLRRSSVIVNLGLGPLPTNILLPYFYFK